MKRKTINCMSCETQADVIVKYSNFEDDELVEVNYCPVCSAEQVNLDELGYGDDDDADSVE